MNVCSVLQEYAFVHSLSLSLSLSLLSQVPFEVASTNQMRRILVEARSVRAQPVVDYSRENSSERRCMICMDNPINTIVLPCGHQVCYI